MPSRKGSPNKVGATAKENILAVFTRIGGTAGMAKWAKDNQTEFYKLYARLIPVEVDGKIEQTHYVVYALPEATQEQWQTEHRLQ